MDLLSDWGALMDISLNWVAFTDLSSDLGSGLSCFFLDFGLSWTSPRTLDLGALMDFSSNWSAMKNLSSDWGVLRDHSLDWGEGGRGKNTKSINWRKNVFTIYQITYLSILIGGIFSSQLFFFLWTKDTIVIYSDYKCVNNICTIFNSYMIFVHFVNSNIHYFTWNLSEKCA